MQGSPATAGQSGVSPRFSWCVFSCEEPPWQLHALWLADRLRNELPNWFKAHHCKGSRGERNIQGLTGAKQELDALMALCSSVM